MKLSRKLIAIFVLAFLASACSKSAGDHSAATIEIQPRIALDISSDSIDLLAQIPAIAGSGYIAAMIQAPPSGGVAIFDGRGHFVKSIARPGGGPGELREVNSVGFGPGDTLWVIDAMFSAHAYTPPPQSVYVRTVHSSQPIVGDATPYGFLSAAKMWTSRVIPPMLIGWDGNEIARFGGERPQAEATASFGGVVRVVDSTTIWAASGNAYAIDEIKSDGTISRRLSRNVDWFPPGLETKGLLTQFKPRPQIHTITLDSAGRLWLVIHRASHDWHAEPSTMPQRPGPIRVSSLLPRTDVSKYLETVIEVLDPVSGVLLGSRTMSGDVLGFAAPGLLCRVSEADGGRMVLRLDSVTMHMDGGRLSSSQPR